MHVQKTAFRHKLALTLLSALVVSGVGFALAATANLPAGTAITSDITTPADGALIAYPAGDVQTTGTASVGEGIAAPDTTFVYVIDVSDSTYMSGGGDCGGDLNSDGESNSVMDCEIAALLMLNSAAVATGTVDEVGVAVFGEGGAVADMTPGGSDLPLTAPDADGHVAAVIASVHHNDGVFDSPPAHRAGVSEFTHKDVGGDATNFAAGLSSALSIVQASTNPHKVVIYLSDGDSNAGALTDFNNTLDALVAAGAVIRSFAVGDVARVRCSGGSAGTLQEMANRSGGSCSQITVPADLPNDIVPAVISSQLTALSLSVDGGAPIDITASGSPALPVTGPGSTAYSHLVPGLMPNMHQLCVTASGSDSGGSGAVTDCTGVKVATISLAPAEAVNELGAGQTHTLTARVLAGPAGGVSGVAVSFDVFAGPNAGSAGSGITDGSGSASFTYPAKLGPAGLGADFIDACFTDSQAHRVCSRAVKNWVDSTAPVVGCIESVNPHGGKIPPAGSTTLPGAKGGQNEDGFYQLTATDTIDPDPKIFLTDTGSGTVFGPFANGSRIKYTEANGTEPRIQSIGSSQGMAGAVQVHILGNGDAGVSASDASQNMSAPAACLVPQPPK